MSHINHEQSRALSKTISNRWTLIFTMIILDLTPLLRQLFEHEQWWWAAARAKDMGHIPRVDVSVLCVMLWFHFPFFFATNSHFFSLVCLPYSKAAMMTAATARGRVSDGFLLFPSKMTDVQTYTILSDCRMPFAKQRIFWWLCLQWWRLRVEGHGWAMSPFLRYAENVLVCLTPLCYFSISNLSWHLKAKEE